MAVGLVLTAATPASAATAGSSSPPPGDSSGFPITVEHALGTTDVSEAPERIVSVGLTEHDTLLALGVIPAAVTDWYGDQPFATWPWAQDELGDAEPVVLTTSDGFDFERIAQLDPDLILGLNAGLDEQSYEQLSAIAPTIAQPVGSSDYFGDWRAQTNLIGRAIGMEEEADALIDDIDARFEQAASEHPEFDGAAVVFLQNAFYDGEAIAYQDGLSTEFLTDLGFEIPSVLDDFTSPGVAQAYIPLEQLLVLDEADVLLWATEGPNDREALESEPLYMALEEVREGHLVFTDGLLAGAIYFTSPLSLPFVLDHLVPALASTLAGDGPAEAFAAEPVAPETTT